MSKSNSGLLVRQRNWLAEAFWKPKSKHSLEQLKYLQYVLTKNSVVSEHNRDLLVETLRSMAEILIWGDQNDARVMDFFLERNMLSFFGKIMKQEPGRFVCVQLLQTLSILFENMRNETSLYYLLSNNHINAIIVLEFDFSDEEVLAYYISFLKTLSLKLNMHTIHFFYNEHLTDFPIYSKAIQFFNHSESMVRIAVRTISLNVYQIGDQAVVDFICNFSAAPYFSNLAWFIGNHVLLLDECIVTKASHFQRDRLESMVAEQLDLVHYVNDILNLNIDALNRLLVTHLMDRLIIPLYIYSLEDGRLSTGTEDQPRIGKLLSLFLLAQKLLIIKHDSLAISLADFIFHGEIRPLPILSGEDESNEKQSGHTRYPSLGSLRAFAPPTERVGVAPIAPISRSSSVNSVSPSPATSSKQMRLPQLPAEGKVPPKTPSPKSHSPNSRSPPVPVAAVVEDDTVSRRSSLASFTDSTAAAKSAEKTSLKGGAGGIVVEKTTSTELIPMMSVHRSATGGGGRGGGGEQDSSGEFTVTMLAQRTTAVGKSRFFSTSEETPDTPRRHSGIEGVTLSDLSDDVAAHDVVANDSSGRDQSPAAAAVAVDETDGNALQGGLVLGVEETAVEVGADVDASVANGSEDESDPREQVAPALSLTSAQLEPQSSPERVEDPVQPWQDGNLPTAESEVDSGVSGVSSEQLPVPTLTTTTATDTSPPDHAVAETASVNGSATDTTSVTSTPHPLQSSGIPAVDGLRVKEVPVTPGMSPYLRTVLSALDISAGDDRLALYSIVLFYALLRHKGLGAEAFENVLTGRDQVWADIRSVMVDHVIQLIGQICRDCSTSRLITLQSALIVLQHLMKDDVRPASASCPAAATTAQATEVGKETVMTRGESTPADGALTSSSGGTPATSREGRVSFEGQEAVLPNSLPVARENSSSTLPAPSSRDPTAAPVPAPSSRDPAAAPVASGGSLSNLAASSTQAPSNVGSDDVDGAPASNHGDAGRAEAVESRACDGQPQAGGGAMHRRISDTHVTRLRGAYADAVRELRQFFKGPSDDMFLDMFEDEYFNITKGDKLNIEYLMNDASTLLPPTPTPLTGIPFGKRLPNGEVERTRRAMQVFLLARQMWVNLLGEEETCLPLMPNDGQLKVDDRPNLMDTDLLACNVYTDDTQKPLKRFFFIGNTQMILVEPDMTQLGWGVVRYVANLEDIDVATDTGDNSLLHVTFHQPLSTRRRFATKQPLRQTINMWQFEFTDHIRCTAAKKRILQACERVKHTKQRKVCALLNVPDLRATTPSSVGFVVGAGGHSPVAPAMASASSGRAVMSPMMATVPHSLPAPMQLAPLVVDTSQPATGAVSRSEGEFLVISVDDPGPMAAALTAVPADSTTAAAVAAAAAAAAPAPAPAAAASAPADDDHE